MPKSWYEQGKKNSSAILFFTCTLIIGLISYKPYGISYDEPVQRNLGLATLAYVSGENDSLLQLINKFHDPCYELMMTLPEKMLNLKTGTEVYHSRHLMNYLVFWIGLIFFYLLTKKTLQNKWLGLLTVFMLYVTPRFFAHSYYNSKDIPLMVFFTISIYCMIIFFEKPGFKNAFLFAFSSGFLFGVRIIGVLVPLFAIAFFILNLFTKNNSLGSVKYFMGYLLLYPLFVFAFYPVLWQHPFDNLITAFGVMSHYPFDTPMIFMGKMISPLQVPWYYVPVWMGITIPLLWQIAFVIGLISILLQSVRRKFSLKYEWKMLLAVAWLFIPWLIIVLLHSTIYDEWRHLFFIYPAFLLIAAFGIKNLFSVKMEGRFMLKYFVQFLFVVLFLWQVIDVTSFMIRNHPYQYVYFNALAGKDVGKNYELDYWGLSYRDGLSYLLQHDSAQDLKVEWQNAPGYYNVSWFTPEEQKRLHEVPFDSCEYFLTNYRLHPDGYDNPTWYAVKVDDIHIMAIQKLR